MVPIARLACETPTKRLKLSSSGSRLATLHEDSHIRLWHTASLELICEIAFDEPVRDFAISPNEHHLVAITASDRIGQACAKTSTGHTYSLIDKDFVRTQKLADCRSAVFVNDEVVAIGRLGRGTKNAHKHFVDICRSTTLETTSTVTLPQYELCFHLACLPSLGLVIALGIGVAVIDSHTYNVSTHVHCDNLDVDWDVWEATCMFAQAKTNQLAVGFDTFHGKSGKRVAVFDAQTWRQVGWYVEESRFPTGVAISDDGRFLASTLYGVEVVLVHEIATGRRLAEFDVHGVSSIAFLPDSDRLIAGGGVPNPLSIWSVTNDT